MTGLDCQPQSKECCRERLFVSFKEIHWDNWILEPRGYHAYRCKGSCASFLHKENPHSIIRQVCLPLWGVGGPRMFARCSRGAWIRFRLAGAGSPAGWDVAGADAVLHADQDEEPVAAVSHRWQDRQVWESTQYDCRRVWMPMTIWNKLAGSRSNDRAWKHSLTWMERTKIKGCIEPSFEISEACWISKAINIQCVA